MSLYRVYLLPHGDEIIDQPNQEAKTMNKVISNLTNDDDSDALVILSPHGVRLSKSIAIVNTERFCGSFRLKTRELRRTLLNERSLTNTILEIAGNESEEVGFITSQGDKSVFPLDFGTLIPLHFFSDKPIVYIGQSRLYDRGRLLAFGEHLYRGINEYSGKVSIVISADQAHTHSSNGPYGYSEEAAKYEEIVIECIRSNDYTPLLDLSEERVSRAKPDSYWNLVVLSSILRNSNKRLIMDYHYVESYFGMLCAHAF